MNTDELFEQMQYHIPIYGQYKFVSDATAKDSTISNKDVIQHSMISAYVPMAIDMAFAGGQAKGFSAYRHVRHVSILTNPALIAGGLFGLLAQQNFALIKSAPKHLRKGMAQMFSSALTGTFGIGSAIEF